MDPVAVIEATDTSFEQQVAMVKIPVAVRFYTPTYNFCHMMEPYFLQYATEYREKVAFVRVNVAANLFTGKRYGVRSTPPFAFFCQGKLVQSLGGEAGVVSFRR